MGPKRAEAKATGTKAATQLSSHKGSGSRDERWVRTQIAALVAQRELAKHSAAWLEEPHLWHEERLGELLQLLGAGTVTSVPDEVRDAVNFYVSQFMEGSETSQEAFYDDREIFGDLLKLQLPEQQAQYVRLVDSPEAEAVIEQLHRWVDTSLQGMDKFVRLWKQHPDSAGVAGAALARISALAAEHKAEAGNVTTHGLAPKSMLALVGAAMGRFPRDAALQVHGCTAVLSLARHSGEGGLFSVLEAGGAKLWVQALRSHIADPAVALIVTRAFAYMTNPKVVVPHSPEWAMLCNCGAEQVLTDVLPYHLHDPRIDKAARTSIPFLRD